ncbi:MAG: succinylglutamate desuccinylase/aspartoacylase family protein [Chthoniobacterales bacterium]|nr:succinylglutamate desuccinylase/aspartoacylase family protein [Chthoniobacterales bacterium]
MNSKPSSLSGSPSAAAAFLAGRCCEQMLRPFWEAVETGLLESGSLGGFLAGGRGYELHRFTLRGPSDGNSVVRLGIFATIHGDEPQGAQALIELARLARRHPDLFRGYELHLYPLCNPTGYEDSTRHSRRGEDLNRHFWRGSSEPEVALLEQEIASRRFHGIIALHADDTSDGVYGFVRGATISQELLAPALDAASARLPVNREPVIDGFRAQGGIIVEGYDGILSAGPSGPRPFEVVFETPAHAALDLQVQATVLAMEAILRRYRAMLSVANDI